MAPPLSTKAVILLALLANVPASAQDAAQQAIADAGPMLPAEALGIPPEAAAQAQGIAVSAEETSIGNFLHRTTVQPIVELARDSGAWIASGSNAAATTARDAGQWVTANASAVTDAAWSASEWIASGSNAAVAMAQNATQWAAVNASSAVDAAQNTGEWIASGSKTAAVAVQDAGQWVTDKASVMAGAAQQTGEWVATGANAVMHAAQNSGELVATGSNAAVSAAQDAGQWIAGGTQSAMVAAQNTGEWVVASTGAALGATAGAVSAAVSSVTVLEDWSIGLVKKLENHLRADGELALLMRESGFVLSNIKVGVGIIPELDVEFRHERTLSREEIAAYKTKVNNHVSKAPAPLSYFEKLLLRRLVKAGEMSSGMRISELHIDLVPLPGLEVFFDPLRFEEEQNRMLTEAHEFAKSGEKNLKSIEERISRIEAMTSAPQAKK